MIGLQGSDFYLLKRGWKSQLCKPVKVPHPKVGPCVKNYTLMLPMLHKDLYGFIQDFDVQTVINRHNHRPFGYISVILSHERLGTTWGETIIAVVYIYIVYNSYTRIFGILLG